MPDPHPMPRVDVLRGLRISTAEGLFATVWGVLTTGAFQTGFALQVGATPFHLGLLAGLPAAVGLLQVPASLVSVRLRRRKAWVGYFSLIGRLLWLPILALPWLVPQASQPILFLVLMGLSAAALTVTVPAWTAWMSDLVPAETRGRYFGHRNTLAGLATMLVPLPAGWLLDRFSGASARSGFALLFGVACLFALGAFAMIMRQPEPSVPRDPAAARPSALLVPLRDPAFRKFLGFASMLVAGQGVAGPFFLTWQLESQGLGLPYLGVQILGGIASGASLLANPYWGYVTDKFGARPVLTVACAVVAVAPVLWLFTDPGRPWNLLLIFILSVTSGIGWSAIGLAQFHLLIGMANPENRSATVGIFSAATGLVGGLAPLLGGWIMEALANYSQTLGPVHWNNFKLVFLISAVLRVLAPLFLRGVDEHQELDSTETVRRVLDVRNVAAMRHVRRLSAPLASKDRRDAIAAIGENRSRLAVAELVSALGDVSPDVRLAAVRSLAEISDPLSIPALGRCLTDPSLAIGTECAEALARIGHRDALPWLLEALEVPDGRLRISAIRALGLLGEPEAGPALLRVMDPAHQTRTETACAAFEQLIPALEPAHIEPALPTLLGLLAPSVPRGIRLAAASAWERLANAPVSGVQLPLSRRLLEETDPAVAARLASCIAKLGWRRPETLQTLETALLRLEGQGLARTQTLLALADWRLGPGTLYPWLGLDAGVRAERLGKMLRDRATNATLRASLQGVVALLEDADDAAVIRSISELTSDPVARFLANKIAPDPFTATFAVLILADWLDHPN